MVSREQGQGRNMYKASNREFIPANNNMSAFSKNVWKHFRFSHFPKNDSIRPIKHTWS